MIGSEALGTIRDMPSQGSPWVVILSDEKIGGSHVHHLHRWQVRPRGLQVGERVRMRFERYGHGALWNVVERASDSTTGDDNG